MPIVEQKSWDECVKKNDDPYGGACVDVAREVMKLLDEREGDFDCHEIICEADKNVDAGGITGFMAGAVASMVSHCHSRGKEFLAKWNGQVQVNDEGDKATEKGAVLNPALLTIDTDLNSNT